MLSAANSMQRAFFHHLPSADLIEIDALRKA